MLGRHRNAGAIGPQIELGDTVRVLLGPRAGDVAEVVMLAVVPKIMPLPLLEFADGYRWPYRLERLELLEKGGSHEDESSIA